MGRCAANERPPTPVLNFPVITAGWTHSRVRANSGRVAVLAGGGRNDGMEGPARVSAARTGHANSARCRHKDGPTEGISHTSVVASPGRLIGGGG